MNRRCAPAKSVTSGLREWLFRGLVAAALAMLCAAQAAGFHSQPVLADSWSDAAHASMSFSPTPAVDAGVGIIPDIRATSYLCQGQNVPFGQAKISLTISNNTSLLQVSGNGSDGGDFVNGGGRFLYTIKNAVEIHLPSDAPIVATGLGCDVDAPNFVQMFWPNGGSPICGYSGSFFGSDNVATCDLYPLAPGQHMQTSFYIQVPKNKDSINVTVTVDKNNSWLLYNTQTLTIPINRPDLIAQFNDSANPPSTVLAGSGFNYNVTFKNVGLGTAGDPVEAVVILPVDGLSSAGVNSNSSGTCQYNHPTFFSHNRSVTCTFDPMGPGASATVSIGATASSTAGTYETTATADPSNRISETDKSNNSALDFTTVVTDTTPPTITAAATTADGSSYTGGAWTNQNVTVTFSCVDNAGGTGVQSFSGPSTLSGDGAGQSVTGVCTDNAGNQSSITFGGINIDKAPPVITYTGRTAPNGAGWNNTSVTLNWSCADGLSGTVSPSVSHAITAEGANQSATATCNDNAGNSASDTEGGVNIDKTPPAITYTGRTAPNGAGWNNTSVVLTWSCSDSLAGPVSATITQTIASEGANQSATGTCQDNAGNFASDVEAGVNIDKTSPAIAYTGRTAPNGAGWNNTSVVLTWSCADSLSGPVSATITQTIGSEGANQSATGTCQDNAGNSASDTEAGVNIDETAPTITFQTRTVPNGAGWNNTDVTVSWTCSDPLSGPVNATATQVVTTEGVNQSASATCYDKAGNSASNTQGGINIDKTPPTLSIAAPVNTSYFLNQVVPSSYSCADNLSGVTACVGTVANNVPIDTGSIGGHLFSVSASDAAGNTTSSSVSYNVTYQICSLYDQTATHKSGSTVPIKIELCDAGLEDVSSTQLTVTATALAQFSTSTFGSPTASGNANPDNNFRFDSSLGTSGGYIYNLSTKGLASGIYLLTFTVTGDPVTHSVAFQVS